MTNLSTIPLIKTMEIHHGKHIQAYISKFNSAIEGTSLEQKSLHEILSDIKYAYPQMTLRLQEKFRNYI